MSKLNSSDCAQIEALVSIIEERSATEDDDVGSRYCASSRFKQRLVTSTHVFPADQACRPTPDLQIAGPQPQIASCGLDEADDRGFDDLISDVVGVSICQQKYFSRCHVKIFLRSAGSVLRLCFVGQLLVVLIGATQFSVHLFSV